MNAALRFLLLLALTGVLSACASTGATVSDARATEAAPTPGVFVTDREYVTRVQFNAVRRGINVHWVNPPTMRVVQEQ